jgi:hypothetical protein
VKKLSGAMAVVVAGIVLATARVSAEELWDPYLRGVNEGLAAGALPPSGVYGVLDNYWMSYALHDHDGVKVAGTDLSALVEVPIVLWVPGIRILGADYAAAIAQPFDYTSSPGLSNTTGAGNWGTFNTILIPGQLSWTLGDFHLKAGFEVYLPDASSTMVDLLHGHLRNGGMPSGNGYAAVQPDLAVSWLTDGWNLSADLHLVIPVTADTATNYNYRSGDECAADYTAVKTIGHWTLGLGAHQENQLKADTLNGRPVTHSNASNLGAGPMLGYQFTEIGVIAEWNRNIRARNDVAGDFVNVRFVVRF